MEDIADPNWKTDPSDDLLYKMWFGTGESEYKDHKTTLQQVLENIADEKLKKYFTEYGQAKEYRVFAYWLVKELYNSDILNEDYIKEEQEYLEECL